MTRGAHRCRGLAGAVLAVLAMQPAAQGATAESGADDASLLYLSSSDWERQSAPRKVALAADFMRIFCTDQRMSAASLVDCLDHDTTDDVPFERAIACVSAR